MGDRVAVMRKGELQQVGAPQELYDRPVEPLRRRLHRQPGDEPRRGDARARGRRLRRGGRQPDGSRSATRRSRPGPALKDYEGRDVILGIRPEDLEDAELEPDRDQTLDGEVELTEALGSEIMVHFSIDAPPAITDEVRELQEDAGTDDGLGAPEHGGGRPHDHGRPLRRPLEGGARASRSRSPSTRALCISSIRRRVSASTTEPKERKHEDDEATLHSARAARSAYCVPRRRLRRRRQRGGRHGRRRPRRRRRATSPATSASSAVWTGAEGESFQAVLDGFTEENPDVNGQLQVGGGAVDRALDGGRGRQPARHRGRCRSRAS